ncbi:DUF6249 domain-containing protein [Seonamhaeicola sp.]|uniref:DUF6249 domain-containing protein n=1 Tax=Seonamhaeicola sp. TaxID=1912245 RepID=UPI0026163C2A|nr:DUF6249 domain-containing protein [Seonamhaeicola sp.]
MEAVIVFIIFGTIFGMVYLYFSTRNKERLALIEKGADASIFVKGKREHTAPIWKVLILNLALLLIGIGLGTFIASILENYTTLEEGPLYVGTIFLMAGLGLFVGFNMTKNLDKE